MHEQTIKWLRFPAFLPWTDHCKFSDFKKKKTELFCANGVPCKKWSDEECKNLCKDLRKVLKDVRRQKETKYNALMRRKKRQYIMAKVHDDVMHS